MRTHVSPLTLTRTVGHGLPLGEQFGGFWIGFRRLQVFHEAGHEIRSHCIVFVDLLSLGFEGRQGLTGTKEGYTQLMISSPRMLAGLSDLHGSSRADPGRETSDLREDGR